MINIIMSNLLIVITVLAMCGWILLSTCAANSLQTADRTILLSDKIQEAAKVEFVLNNCSNILRSPLKADKHITLLNRSLPHTSIPTAFNTTLVPTSLTANQTALKDIVRRPILAENIKIHHNLRYAIDKINQEYNLKNSQKQAASSLSNIKLLNSSNVLPTSSASSSSYPRTTTTATAAGIAPTNSKFTAASYFERAEMHEYLMRSKDEKLLLHRKKRYLVFPEGSSFQLVFDLIIPIVDYTKFAIMGITCAVAWELPSQPPSAIIENFRTKLNDGTLGLSRRNDSTLQPLVHINSRRTEQQVAEDENRWRESVAEVHNHNIPQLSPTTATTSGREHFLAYIPKPPALLQPSGSLNYNNNMLRERHQQPSSFPYYAQQPQQQHNYDYGTLDANQRKTFHANTNGRSPMYRNEFYPYVRQQPQQANALYSNVDSYVNKDNWWKRHKNHTEIHSPKNQPKWWKHHENPQVNFPKLVPSERMGRKRQVLNKPPRHRIYPIFGKRRRRRSSGDHQAHFNNHDMAKEMHDIHTKEHLQTRLKLYGKIEKLYETRGQNGSACVLRALCETERMHLNAHNETPQSFVMELLRSIFALPKDTLTNSKEPFMQIDDRYVNAVVQAHDVSLTCTQQYDDCGYSITYNT